MDLNAGYTFDEFGNLVPNAGMANLPMMPQFGMSRDVNALPPGLQAPLADTTPLPQSFPNDPMNVIPEPTAGTTPSPILDKAKAAAKAAGNLTPQQVQALGALTGSTQRAAPAGAGAAVPKGLQGNMQQHALTAPRLRPTLSQLIYGR